MDGVALAGSGPDLAGSAGHGEGRAVVEMPAVESMRNFQGTVHGGFISMLADSAMGRSIATVLPLPLVPATRTDGNRRSGFPNAASNARMRSSLTAR